MVGTATMREHGSHIGEPAASTAKNNAFEQCFGSHTCREAWAGGPAAYASAQHRPALSPGPLPMPRLPCLLVCC